MKRRAVFLDRDGVLVKAVQHGEYAHGPLALADFKLHYNVEEPVRMLREAGFLTVLATNQPGIARGTLTWETLRRMHEILQREVPLDAIQVCPHTDADGCPCRKPKPGMILNAAETLSIDLASSYFVGDTWRDVDAGLAAGVTPVLLDWTYNRNLQVSHRVANLAGAAKFILETAEAARI
ncbi:MAG: HAD family hydrolase [Bryobacteraceae bacterium]